MYIYIFEVNKIIALYLSKITFAYQYIRPFVVNRAKNLDESRGILKEMQNPIYIENYYHDIMPHLRGGALMPLQTMVSVPGLHKKCVLGIRSRELVIDFALFHFT